MDGFPADRQDAVQPKLMRTRSEEAEFQRVIRLPTLEWGPGGPDSHPRDDFPTPPSPPPPVLPSQPYPEPVHGEEQHLAEFRNVLKGIPEAQLVALLPMAGLPLVPVDQLDLAGLGKVDLEAFKVIIEGVVKANAWRASLQPPARRAPLTEPSDVTMTEVQEVPPTQPEPAQPEPSDVYKTEPVRTEVPPTQPEPAQAEPSDVYMTEVLEQTEPVEEVPPSECGAIMMVPEPVDVEEPSDVRMVDVEIPAMQPDPVVEPELTASQEERLTNQMIAELTEYVGDDLDEGEPEESAFPMITRQEQQEFKTEQNPPKPKGKAKAKAKASVSTAPAEAEAQPKAAAKSKARAKASDSGKPPESAGEPKAEAKSKAKAKAKGRGKKRAPEAEAQDDEQVTPRDLQADFEAASEEGGVENQPVEPIEPTKGKRRKAKAEPPAEPEASNKAAGSPDAASKTFAGRYRPTKNEQAKRRFDAMKVVFGDVVAPKVEQSMTQVQAGRLVLFARAIP